MALCVFYLLTKSYRVFDLSVCATVYGQLAGLMCVAVVAISWTKHCQYIVAYTKLHQITYSKYCQFLFMSMYVSYNTAEKD